MTTTMSPGSAPGQVSTPDTLGSASSAVPVVDSVLAGWRGLGFIGAVGGWLGAMVFFSAIATPQVFGVLGTEAGASVVAAMFPRYYLLGTVCSVVGALLLWLAARRGAGQQHRPILCLLVGAVILLLSWLVLEPQVAAARGGFRGALHLLSIGLNGVDLLLTVAALALVTMRR